MAAALLLRDGTAAAGDDDACCVSCCVSVEGGHALWWPTVGTPAESSRPCGGDLDRGWLSDGAARLPGILCSAKTFGSWVETARSCLGLLRETYDHHCTTFCRDLFQQVSRSALLLPHKCPMCRSQLEHHTGLSRNSHTHNETMVGRANCIYPRATGRASAQRIGGRCALRATSKAALWWWWWRWWWFCHSKKSTFCVSRLTGQTHRQRAPPEQQETRGLEKR